MSSAEPGAAFGALIERDLKLEHERRTSLDARGLAIVTSSSGLLTLLVALTALVTGKEYQVSAAGAWGVVAALAGFVVAAVLGLVANASREYEVASIATMGHMTTDHWADDDLDARRVCAKLSVATITSLRVGNNGKATLVVWAFGFQIGAIAVLALTLGWELRTALL